MEKLELKESFSTPRIIFDPDSGVLLMKGRSIPEDPEAFYAPVNEWLDNYRPEKTKEIKVICQFYYYNTSSSKRILGILKKLNSLYEDGYDVKIIWEYEEGDEDAYDDGLEFNNLLKVPFELVEVPEDQESDLDLNPDN